MAAKIGEQNRHQINLWTDRVGHIHLNPSVKSKIPQQVFERFQREGLMSCFSCCYELDIRKDSRNRSVQWCTPSIVQEIPVTGPHSVGVTSLPFTEVHVSIIVSSYDSGVPLTLPSDQLQFLAKTHEYLLVILSHQLLRSKSNTQLNRLQKILNSNHLRLLEVCGPLSKVSWGHDLLIASEKLYPHIRNVNSYEVKIPSFAKPAFISYVEIDTNYFFTRFDFTRMDHIRRTFFAVVGVLENVYSAAITYLPEYQIKKTEQATDESVVVDTGEGVPIHDTNDNTRVADKGVKKDNEKINNTKRKVDHKESLGPEVVYLIERRRKKLADFERYGRQEDWLRYVELVELVKDKLTKDN